MDCLPECVPLIAIAGVWGDYRSVRCLFMDADGYRYVRNIRNWSARKFMNTTPLYADQNHGAVVA